MVQRHWRDWGEGKVRAWAGVGRVQALGAAQPHTGKSTNLPHIPESRNGWSISAP